MSCYSQDELRAYLLGQLAAESQARVEEHVAGCAACRQMLDDLASDGIVRDYLGASRQDASSAWDTADPAGSLTNGAVEQLPPWRAFTEDDTQMPVQFGRFVLKEVLGSGGFGVVYRADDMNLEREVAVKIPHLGGLSPDVQRRFVQEGTAAANLHHPHIVPVYHSGAHQGVCFLVSEYCPGRTLRQWLDESHSAGSTQQAARLVLKLAEAVEHAHQHGVVHRDIKPANVILDARGARDGLPYCPKLTDFGTAKILGANESMTASGMLIGTAPYMAPERISGEEEVGPACDIYALGVLLYELIAGQPPLHGADRVETIHKVVTCEPVALHQQAPGVHRDISAICGCCLEKNPQRRYPAAEQLAIDLRRFLNNEPTTARPLGAAARLLRWSRRNPLPVTIMGMVCLVFVLVVCGFVWHTARLRDLNDQLTTSNQQALQLKDRAQQSELQARRMQYASDIRLAEKSWRENDPRSVRDILARHIPGSGEADLRGLEWYFLKRAVTPKAETIAETGAPLYFLRLSPDQKLFAVAGQDAVIRIYDRASGVLWKSIESGQGEVNSVAFSPDGATLASAGDDGSVRLWRLSDGNQLDHFWAHDGLAFGVEYTPDGKHLVTCGADNRVHVWKNGHKEATYNDHGSRVEAIAVSPDGRWLASVGKDRTLVVRNLGSGERHLKSDPAHGTLSSVAFATDSKTAAVVEVAGPTKWLRLFDIASRKQILARRHPDAIRSVAFSPRGDRVLTLDNKGTARIWDVTSREKPFDGDVKPQKTWPLHDSRGYCGAFEPGGTSVLTVGKDGTVRRLNLTESLSEEVLDRSRLSKKTGLPESHFLLFAIAFQPNRPDILAAARRGIAIVKLDSNNSVQFERQRENYNWWFVAAPDLGDWFVVGGVASENVTRIGLRLPPVVERWESPSGPSRSLLRPLANCGLLDLCCSPRGDMLALVVSQLLIENQPKKLLLVDSESGAILHEYSAGAATTPRFTPDGNSLVYGAEQEIHLVDLRSQRRRLIQDPHLHGPQELSVSGDGKWLATSDGGRELKIWNLATLKQHAVFQGHQRNITALEFSRDSRTLLSSSKDGTVKAWSVVTGQQLMDLHRGEIPVDDMAISSDGGRLAIIEDGQRIRVYRIGQ